MTRSHRQIEGLVWARPCPRPRSIPRSRPKGSRALGLTYERAIAKALPKAEYGPWFEFEDAFGHGFCQPDFVLGALGRLWVLESKLSARIEAELQIKELYQPVLEHCFNLPVHGIVVTKHLRPETDLRLVHDSLARAMANVCVREGVSAETRAGLNPALGLPIVHWIGKGPL